MTVPLTLMMASSRVSSPPTKAPAAPRRLRACHTRLPWSLARSAAGSALAASIGPWPLAVERVSKTSPTPLTIASRLVSSLCFRSKALATSLTMPLAN